MRQKGESQNGCFKSTEHAKSSEKRTFLHPWYAHVRELIRGKKCSFFEKFGVLCFLETPVLRFALLPYYWRTSCYFQKLLYTESTSTLFLGYKRLRAPLTCGRFISNASIVVSSCLTSAPVGTEILYCSPVQSRSWSYANFLSPSIIKNFFFLQRKKEIQFLLG